MAESISKLQRWMDVVAFLAGRHFPVSQEELWEGVPAYAAGLEGGGKDPESVRRMFERDKDELRALGIPIETVTFHIQEGSERSHGYRLENRRFHLPYLRLVRAAEAEADDRSGGSPPPSPRDFVVAEDEVAAALEGLRDVSRVPGFPLAREARSAFRKLAFDLDPDLLGPSPVVYVADPEAEAAAETLRRLSDALLARKRATFRYRSMERDDEAVRTVHPYGLLFQHGRWYLVAWAADRKDTRMFRLGRVAELSVNTASPGTADYEIPADFDLTSYAGRKAWELAGEGDQAPAVARVWFRFPRSVWAERNGYGTLAREEEDGSQIREIAVHRAEPFLRWVLSLEGDARIEDPPELQAAFLTMVHAVAERYGAAKGGPHG
ncbi:MAG: WYL domain-containing protein [Gemmatimonadetes bacterium]|nr:WYL domain-containing protein [Gemmatimonadota bacterium]